MKIVAKCGYCGSDLAFDRPEGRYRYRCFCGAEYTGDDPVEAVLGMSREIAAKQRRGNPAEHAAELVQVDR